MADLSHADLSLGKVPPASNAMFQNSMSHPAVPQIDIRDSQAVEGPVVFGQLCLPPNGRQLQWKAGPELPGSVRRVRGLGLFQSLLKSKSYYCVDNVS